MAGNALLDRFVAWAEAEDTIRAAILLGSRARVDPPADEWSDSDVLVFTSDPDRWLRDGGWLEALGPVVVTFVEQTGLEGLFERRGLFADGADIDLVIIPLDRLEDAISARAALPVLARGHRLLLDKDGRLADLPARVAAADSEALIAAAPWPPDADEVRNLIGNFWYHAVWVVKKLRRGELTTALGGLNGHMGRILLRLVEWQAKARSKGAASTWFDGRFLERWAVPATVEALRDTVSRYDERDAARALRGQMRLFAALAREVATAASVSYPEEAERWVTSWVEGRLDEAGLVQRPGVQPPRD